MTENLLTPIVNNRTLSVNFFNGRLLTGEDLTAEQKVNRVAHSLLGQGIGSGVAYGLEVSESAKLSTPQAPVLSVKQGLAINPNGGTLLLDSDTDISLVRSPTPTNSGTSAFQACVPTQSSFVTGDKGVYLLTIGSAPANQGGLAEVSGLNNGAAPCNSKYKADGVQFRLLQIDLTQQELGDENHLRNLVAYKCFGVSDWAVNITDPFGTPPIGHGLIDQLRTAKTLTGCEVPLAVLYWTATAGLKFVDIWAVRRPLVSRDLLDSWAPGAGQRRFVEGLAMFMQFQAQLQAMVERGVGVPLTSVAATDFFKYLPAVGFLPINGLGVLPGFDYIHFFNNQTVRPPGPVFVRDATLEALVRGSFLYPPIDLSIKELIWLYLVPGNSKLSNQQNGAVPYVVFASAYTPYQGDSRYDASYWNLSNYSLTVGEFIVTSQIGR